MCTDRAGGREDVCLDPGEKMGCSRAGLTVVVGLTVEVSSSRGVQVTCGLASHFTRSVFYPIAEPVME
jgi:hypothetical protein